MKHRPVLLLFIIPLNNCGVSPTYIRYNQLRFASFLSTSIILKKGNACKSELEELLRADICQLEERNVIKRPTNSILFISSEKYYHGAVRKRSHFSLQIIRL
jgi:hypothetical protein